MTPRAPPSQAGCYALIENPAVMARLQSNPDMLPDAAEEMVRWVSPVKHFFRTAVADYDIRGKTIKAGDSIFISYPSGNRDEEAFDRPFEFIPDRSPTGISATATEFMRALAGIWPRPKSWRFSVNCSSGSIGSNWPAVRPGRKPPSSAG